MEIKGKMSNTVLAHNDVLQAPLQTLKEFEINALMGVLSTIKDKGTTTVVVPYSNFTRIASSGNYISNKAFKENMREMRRKLQRFSVEYEENGVEWEEIIFPKIGFRDETKEVLIEVSDSFARLVNYALMDGNFTQLSYAEITEAKGKYTKLIYWYLRKYSDIGVWTITFDSFKEILGIPSSYNANDIHKQIIIPALEELIKYFPNLKYFEARGVRGKIVDCLFVFDTEMNNTAKGSERESLLKKVREPADGIQWFLYSGESKIETKKTPFGNNIMEDCPF